MKISEVKSYKHIVIAYGDDNSLGVVRSLGELGICPIVILIDCPNKCLITKCKYCGQIITIPDENELIGVLKSFVSEQKSFVYNGSDLFETILDKHYDELIEYFYFFNAGSNGKVSFYMDKKNICSIAEECGFNVPKNERVNVGELPKTLRYPVFTKTIAPYLQGWKRDVGIYYNEQELLEAYKWYVSEQMLLQEYINKTYDYTIQGISINGGEDVFVPYINRYLRFTSTTFGGYLRYEPLKDTELINKIKLLMKKIGYSGVFGIDFIDDAEGNRWFLEVNFRFDAANYAIHYAGVNLPTLWAMSTLSGKIDLTDVKTIDHDFYVMNEMVDIKFARKAGIFKWLKQFFSADCYYLWNKKDIKPCFAYWWHYIKKHL